MKLPRWLVIGMWTTSVLAVLAAAGWWWVTWPERTAFDWGESVAHGRQWSIEAQTRTLRNVARGRQNFIYSEGTTPRLGILVERRQVLEDWPILSQAEANHLLLPE